MNHNDQTWVRIPTCVAVLRSIVNNVKQPQQLLPLLTWHSLRCTSNTHTHIVISRQPTFLTGTTYLTPAEYSLLPFASLLQSIFHSSSLPSFPRSFCVTRLSPLLYLVFYFLPSPNSFSPPSFFFFPEERKSDSDRVNRRHEGPQLAQDIHLNVEYFL